MAKLIVGRFDDIEDVERVRSRPCRSEGLRVRTSAPSTSRRLRQHQIYPIGGDAYSDEGARGAGAGAAAGAAMGGATGLAIGALAAAALPFIPIAGVLAAAGIGAYTGSLMGALSRTQPAEKSEATPEHPVERPGGPRVAIRVDRTGAEDAAIEVLERFGAKDIERGEGEWHARMWQDYDPRVPLPPVREAAKT